MTVYVDSLIKSFGACRCHMIADTMDEMHKMAEGILGCGRRGFHNTRIPHYDLSQKKRLFAIELGAIEVSSKEIIKIQRRIDEHKNNGE